MLPRLVLAASLLIAVGCSAGSSGSPEVLTVDDAGATTPADTAAPTATEPAATTPTTAPTSTTAAAPTSAPVTTTAATAPPAATTVPCRVVAAQPVGLGAEPDPSMAVRRGDCGPGVVQIQELLRDRWEYAITADGRFGPAADTAVRDFQSSFMGVTPDGIVGPNTWAALNSDDFDPADA